MSTAKNVFSMLLFTSIHAKTSLDIFAMGDWGGSPNSPYTTTDEVKTATIMGQVGAIYDVDFVWGLGDNFYDDGVKNEYDPRFEETFENVFNAQSLQNTSFYFVAGNHDHNGNVSGEIYYSNHSTRWIFPDYWYNIIYPIPSSTYTLELIMIDTILACGISYSREYCNKMGIKDCPIQPRGASDQLLASKQWDWIDKTIKESTAEYLIVGGHYPIYSIAEHGSTLCLEDKLNPTLIEYNATAYVSGHDHTFEYIYNGNIGYIDTGGGHDCDTSTEHSHSIPKDSLKFHGCDGGFTRFKANETGLYVYYYFGNSTKEQYSVQFEPRKV